MRVRKSGPGVFGDQQQKLIGQTLKFANMRELLSTRQVESLFTSLDFFGYPDPANPSRRLYDSLNPGGDPQKEVEGLGAFEKDRDKLREILAMILEKKTEAIREVNAGLSAVILRMALSPGGEIRIAQLIGGVQAAVHYALALILNPTITKRLSRCGAPNCRKFIFDFAPKWRKHCNEAHRRAADRLKSPARSKEWRDAKRPARKLRSRIDLENRVKNIVEFIKRSPQKLDGTEVDPLNVKWQDREYDVAEKIRKQVRAGCDWRNVLKKLTNGERRTLTRMKIGSASSSV